MVNYSNSKYPLHTLFFEVTSRCNALCDHCGSRCTASKKDELSPETFKKVLDDVAKNFGTKAIMLNITGGEPLMRKDLFEITGYALHCPQVRQNGAHTKSSARNRSQRSR